MQICPEFRKAPNMIYHQPVSSSRYHEKLTLLAAIFTSAPGKTSAGDLPPSSITDGLPVSSTFYEKDDDILQVLAA
jgi:hypothetical protein